MTEAFGPRGYEPHHKLFVVSPLGGAQVSGTKEILADCGHLAAIAPSGLAFMGREPDARTVCLRCYTRDPRLRTEERPVVFRAEGAVQELENELHEKYDREFIDWVRNNFEEA